jgi:hypothetical protein
MLFGPMTPQDAQEYIWRCAALAAKARGLKDSGWYTPEEIVLYLRRFPDTAELFEQFERAYTEWAELNYRTHDTRARDVCDPATLQDLNDLTRKRDDTRSKLLEHLHKLKA